jgi:hypothetical protein
MPTYRDSELAGALTVISVLVDLMLEARLIEPQRLDERLGELCDAYDRRGQRAAAGTVEWVRRGIQRRNGHQPRGVLDLPPVGRA